MVAGGAAARGAAVSGIDSGVEAAVVAVCPGCSWRVLLELGRGEDEVRHHEELTMVDWS